MKLIKRLIYTKNYRDNYPANENTIYDLCKSGNLQYISRTLMRKYAAIEIRVRHQYRKSYRKSYMEKYEIEMMLESLYNMTNIHKKYVECIDQINNNQNMIDVMSDFDRYMLSEINDLSGGHRKINKAVEKINLLHDQRKSLFIEYTNGLMELYRFNLLIEAFREYFWF